MRSTRTCLLAFLFASGLAWGNDPVADTQVPEVDESGLAVVLVMGEQPGPGLWKVSSGERVLWILGEVSPIPRKVRWKSVKFERLLRNSQELLLDLSGSWLADAAEMTAYREAEKLPRGTSLADVISPELNRRVKATARKYGAFDLQELRPFAATNRLVVSAMRTLGLKAFSARFVAEDLAKKRDIRITYFAAPEPPFDKRLETWKQDSNAACLARVVETLRDGGTGVKRLANAWSVGDIEAMRGLVSAYSFSRDGLRAAECAAAMRGGERQADEYAMGRRKGWMNEAERALRDNRSTMAVVLMSELFAADGYLAALRAHGYDVVEPR
jgi:uncharacterized protein YbaP (TraB family)